MKNIYILFLFIIFIISLSFCDDDNTCNAMSSAYDPLDCFELESLNQNEKCCLFEYKDKEKNRIIRRCLEITLDEFLEIDKTIKQYEKNNKNIKIKSLECDNSSILSISKYIIIFILLLI